MSEKRLKIEPISYAEDVFKIRLSDSDLKPGENSRLMVKLNRKLEMDKFEKSITFELNDNKKTRFTVPVTLKPPAEKAEKKPPARKPQGK